MLPDVADGLIITPSRPLTRHGRQHKGILLYPQNIRFLPALQRRVRDLKV